MNRANPKQLRQALETASEMVKGGILFVCMPVLDDEDYAELLRKMIARMEQLEAKAEAEESQS